jgi:hypothetical protein
MPAEVSHLPLERFSKLFGNDYVIEVGRGDVCGLRRQIIPKTTHSVLAEIKQVESVSWSPWRKTMLMLMPRCP